MITHPRFGPTEQIRSHSQPVGNLLEALAIATIMKYNGDAPEIITAQNINNLAHVLDQAQLEIGYAALLNPQITPTMVQGAFMGLYLSGEPVGLHIPIPTLFDDQIAAILIGHQSIF